MKINNIKPIKLNNYKRLENINKSNSLNTTNVSYASNPITKISADTYMAYSIPFTGRAISQTQKDFDKNTSKRLLLKKKEIKMFKEGKYGTINYLRVTKELEILKEQKKKLQDENSIVERTKVVKNKKYWGADLYDNKRFINWEDKLGFENLYKDNSKPINFERATKEDVIAFWHSNGLAETHDDNWVRTYNPTNRTVSLSTGHTLLEESTIEKYENNLIKLKKIDTSKPKYKFIDKPIINAKNGNLNLEFVVFDTETTGINTYMPRTKRAKVSDLIKGVDKILQIGALKTDSKGMPIETTAIDQLINPERKINPKAQAVHGFGYDQVKDKPTIEQLLKPFMTDYVGDKPLVAYNAKFDVTLINNAIFLHNKTVPAKKKMDEIPLEAVLDPMIIMQRIHPFIGASKKQTNIYRMVLGRNLDDAHDALVDVKGTTNVLKYAVNHLNRRFMPTKDHPALTVRDILNFQWGKNVEGLQVKLNNSGYDRTKKFDKSYQMETIDVYNFPEGNYIPGTPRGKNVEKYNEILDNIGQENLDILKKRRFTGSLYKKTKNFKKALVTFKLKPYKNMEKEEIVQYLIDNTMKYKHFESINTWVKNPRPEDRLDGNDLPDMKVLKRLDKEERLDKEAKAKETKPKYTDFGVEIAEALNREAECSTAKTK